MAICDFILWVCCDVRLYPKALQREEADPRNPRRLEETWTVLGVSEKAKAAFLSLMKHNLGPFVSILADGSGGPPLL